MAGSRTCSRTWSWWSPHAALVGLLLLLIGPCSAQLQLLNWTSSPDVFRSQLVSALTDSASVRSALTRQLGSVRRVLRPVPPVSEPPPNTTELCRRNGHGSACELHVVSTEDGFLLTVVRIRARREAAPVMLVLHGDLTTSDSWMMRKDNSNFGTVLHEAGYDVWLGNFRGNTHARQHVSLKHTDPEFWNWSWHEMGLYDIPAMTDYVLEHTGQASLHFVGHSMATSAFLVAMSLRPEYNSKIRSAHLMSPAIRMRGFIRQVSDGVFGNALSDLAEQWLTENKHYEIWPRLALWHYIGDVFCVDSSPLIELCYSTYEQILGKTHHKQRIPNLLAIFGAYHPAGTSLRCLQHYGAVNLHGKFQPLGKGVDDPNPGPEYNLSVVSAPVSLYYSLGDGIISPKDVGRLAGALPRLELKYLVPLKEFNHVDFMWAKDVKELLYDRVLKMANEIESRLLSNDL